MQEKEKMRDLIIIVAYSLDGRVIGIKGVNGQKDEIPFVIMSDKFHFKKVTTGHTVISGRSTHESIPDEYRPLQGRINIVLSRAPDYVPSWGDVPHDENTALFQLHSLEAAFDAAKFLDTENEKEIFIGGGGEIYRQVLEQFAHRIKKIIATEVDGTIDGNVYFPELDLSKWRREEIKRFEMVPDKNSHSATVVEYTPIETE